MHRQTSTIKKPCHVVLCCCVIGLSGTASLAPFATNQHVTLMIATALFTAGAIASLASVLKHPASSITRSGSSVLHAQKPTEQLSDAPTKAGLWKQACYKLAEDYSLTPRETEILVLLLKAQTIRRISQSLVISEHTTKTHVYNMYKKIGINTRSELSDSFEMRLADLKKHLR